MKKYYKINQGLQIYFTILAYFFGFMFWAIVAIAALDNITANRPELDIPIIIISVFLFPISVLMLSLLKNEEKKVREAAKCPQPTK